MQVEFQLRPESVNHQDDSHAHSFDVPGPILNTFDCGLGEQVENHAVIKCE